MPDEEPKDRATSSPVPAESVVTLVQVSDTHLSRTHGYFFANWDVFVREMNEQQPDLIVNSGDVSFNGPISDDDIEFARSQHDRIVSPWRAVAGNHDVGEAVIASRLDQVVDEHRLLRWDRSFGSGHWVQDLGSWRIIGLNTALMGSGLAQELMQEAFFQQALDSRDGRPVMAVVHMPPYVLDPADSSFTTSAMPFAVRESFLSRCVAGGVRVIACGHVHHYRAQDYQGIAIVCAPGTSFVRNDNKGIVDGKPQKSGYLVWTLKGLDITHELVEPALFINHDMSNWGPSTTELPPRGLLQGAF